MSGLILFFKSKVVLAALGAVLFGTAGALVAVVPFGSAPSHPSSNTPQGQAGSTTQDTATATSGDSTPGSATSTATPGKTATPTQTPTQAPTTTPTPRPTSTTGTGTTSVSGRVQSKNTSANTFTIQQSSGTIITVAVTTSTTYQGHATSLSSLQAGWKVIVTGAYQGGTFVATNVNAYDD